MGQPLFFTLSVTGIYYLFAGSEPDMFADCPGKALILFSRE